MSTDEALYGVVKRAVVDALRELRHPAADGEPELMKLAEVAMRLRVSESWLKGRIADGTLPVFGGRRMRRVRPSDVRALLAERPTAERAETPQAVALRLLGASRR